MDISKITVETEEGLTVSFDHWDLPTIKNLDCFDDTAKGLIEAQLMYALQDKLDEGDRSKSKNSIEIRIDPAPISEEFKDLRGVLREMLRDALEEKLEAQR